MGIILLLSGSANHVRINLSVSPKQTKVSVTLVIPISDVDPTLSNLIPIKFFLIFEFDNLADAVALVTTYTPPPDIVTSGVSV